MAVTRRNASKEIQLIICWRWSDDALFTIQACDRVVFQNMPKCYLRYKAIVMLHWGLALPSPQRNVMPKIFLVIPWLLLSDCLCLSVSSWIYKLSAVDDQALRSQLLCVCTLQILGCFHAQSLEFVWFCVIYLIRLFRRFQYRSKKE